MKKTQEKSFTFFEGTLDDRVYTELAFKRKSLDSPLYLPEDDRFIFDQPVVEVSGIQNYIIFFGQDEKAAEREYERIFESYFIEWQNKPGQIQPLHDLLDYFSYRYFALGSCKSEKNSMLSLDKNKVSYSQDGIDQNYILFNKNDLAKLFYDQAEALIRQQSDVRAA